MLEGLTLHHVGFVVRDVERAIPGFQKSTQAEWDGRIWQEPHQKVTVAFLKVGGGAVLIELVSPAAPDSPVTQFLEQGGGLHHLCYEVEDLESRLAEMRALGNLLVRGPLPAVAFGNRRIAWVMTREKLLLEFLERA